MIRRKLWLGETFRFSWFTWSLELNSRQHLEILYPQVSWPLTYLMTRKCSRAPRRWPRSRKPPPAQMHPRKPPRGPAATRRLKMPSHTWPYIQQSARSRITNMSTADSLSDAPHIKRSPAGVAAPSPGLLCRFDRPLHDLSRQPFSVPPAWEEVHVRYSAVHMYVILDQIRSGQVMSGHVRSDICIYTYTSKWGYST